MGSVLLLSQILCLLFFHSHFQPSLSSSNFSSPVQLCPADQSLALLQFKNSFPMMSSSPSVFGCYPQPKTVLWREGTDCCSWDGVTCNMKTGHVIGLHLYCSMLHGTLHSNSTLFFLHHLQKLDLSFNYFDGSVISSSFGQLLHLTHLNLNSSNFAGQVPPEISHLSRLASLDLSFNYLMLEPISFNKLAQNLTQLRELNLNEVNMSLVVPSSFMNLSSSLTSLQLWDCGLQGELPVNVFRRSNLQSLDLWSNGELTGSFPPYNLSNALSELEMQYKMNRMVAQCRQKCESMQEKFTEKLEQLHTAYQKMAKRCQMMEQEIESLSKDKQELQENFSEKARQKRKLDEMYDQLRSEYESNKRSAIQPANNFFSRNDPDLFSNPAATMMDNRDPIRKGPREDIWAARQNSSNSGPFEISGGSPAKQAGMPVDVGNRRTGAVPSFRAGSGNPSMTLRNLILSPIKRTQLLRSRPQMFTL
ncbi:hypothetical protein OIU84_002743 [Salix udensis]|uniref:Leucine-rich repeat-containing N-terminal plant-type domain-containing protein n=1 Tax=Salix udensis TaxID=889485 RepID=A0AAD6K6Z5_9ROSI|nr:hypothetical protein OIU84_002743 [Salix udensis]